MLSTNFPMDAEGRTLHLNWRRGDVHSRIVLVGSTSRARAFAASFDEVTGELGSSRGFLAINGTCGGVSVSIVAVQMGMANMDFVVRELSAIVDGPMCLFRVGTCGTPHVSTPIGTFVVATQGAVYVHRNPDAWSSVRSVEPYSITLPVLGDVGLMQHVATAMATDGLAVECGLNCSADSFYSSQGRQGEQFRDRNRALLELLRQRCPDVRALEMESFHLFDLARCALSDLRVGACALVLANRITDEFLAAEEHQAIMARAGRPVLSAVSSFAFAPRKPRRQLSVWLVPSVADGRFWVEKTVPAASAVHGSHEHMCRAHIKLTAISLNRGDDTELRSTLRQISAVCERLTCELPTPLTLTVDSIGNRPGSEFQCAFARVAAPSWLLRARALLRELAFAAGDESFPDDDPSAYEPHISLPYADGLSYDHQVELLEKLGGASELINRPFRIDALLVVDTSQTFPSWQVLDEFPLPATRWLNNC